MKIYEVISEEENIQEAPVGRLRQLGRKAASYGYSKIGARGAARAKGRQIDVDTEANRIKDDLTTTIKGAGEKMKDVTIDYFENFLTQVGFDDKDINAAIRKFAPDQQLNNKSIDKIILALTRQASKQHASTQRSKFATRSADKDKKGNKGANIPVGTTFKASDKKSYEWKGAQWVDTETNRSAPRNIGKELNAKFSDLKER